MPDAPLSHNFAVITPFLPPLRLPMPLERGRAAPFVDFRDLD